MLFLKQYFITLTFIAIAVLDIIAEDEILFKKDFFSKN